MKLSKRLISIILALLLLLGITCIAAYAAENGGAGDAGAGGDSGYSGDVGNGDSGGADQGDVGDGGYSDGGAGDNSGTDQGTSSDYSGGDDSGYTDPYYNPGYVENNYEEDPMYWGAGSDDSIPDQGSAGAVSDKTTLYDTDDINNKDLEENQWSDIELDESKVAAAGTSDFTQMQTDTTTEDNGQWMLYLGLGLIGLAFLGILYFIIATMQAKKRNDRRSAADRERRENPKGYSQPSRSPERTSSREGRGHYSDGYSAARRKSSSRSDTDEVYLPRRVK